MRGRRLYVRQGTVVKTGKGGRKFQRARNPVATLRECVVFNGEKYWVDPLIPSDKI